ncbi:oxidoreductase [Mycolicibacterium sp. CH28]|uniref:PDR/VanB family oxidoreductase n=1 Tax=Mycolicibacterium sp. CH28 TaxID=2512237 RepID=UPI0010816EF0|nr:PDR/VanB family oxidoreductase [Mycolicibacterium sp. CH28]TGD87852.1 oxidoreductase [Mycolicibacterium sp. CH28]
MSSLGLEVVGIDDDVPGIRTLRLALPDRGLLPSFTPGSHIVIEYDGGANAYSLTGESTTPREYVISVLECSDGRGGSRWIHHGLAIGDAVTVRDPRSAFAPVLSASRHLLIAAGIGITPMVSHLRSARRWGRDAELLYVYRDGRGAYVDEIKALTDGARFFTGRAPFLAELAATLADSPLGTHAYICGPGAFIDDVTALATGLGWPPSRIHVEHFGGDLSPGEPFEVELTSTGETFVVDSGVSLLDALEEHEHAVASMCRQGVCGECRIPVHSGTVLHRDLYLSEAERAAGDAMMACVSRADGRLELEL